MRRGLRKRCPLCAEKSIWRSWSQLDAACPRCGFRFERESGYWVGAIAVNIAIAELVFAFTFVPALIVTWPDIPWQPLVAIALVTNTILPIWFFPRSKTLWLGLDLYFNPGHAHESTRPGTDT